MHVVFFETKDSLPLEVGSIIKYVASDYQMDYQNYKHLFQVIGDPPEGNNAQLTHWTLPTTEAPYITHIKVSE